MDSETPDTEPQAAPGPAEPVATPAEPTAEQNGTKPPDLPRIVLVCSPYAVQIDGGGLPLEIIENKLLSALAYIQRELVVKRIRETERSVQLVGRLPRMNP